MSQLPKQEEGDCRTGTGEVDFGAGGVVEDFRTGVEEDWGA